MHTRRTITPATVRNTTTPAALLTASEIRDLAGLPAADPPDATLEALAVAAVQQAEAYTRRAFVERSVEVTYDLFPRRDPPRVPRRPWWLSPGFAQGFEIPYPPLISIDEITAYAYDGTPEAVAASTYLVNDRTEPGTVTPKQGAHWPTEVLPEGGVVIAATIGYGAAAAVPEAIKRAVAMQAAYVSRDAEGIASESIDNAEVSYLSGGMVGGESRADPASGLVRSAKALLAPFRIAYL